ncbi:MAG TPA: NHL repeat-containing protein, partial [Stenomitos sp.]
HGVFLNGYMYVVNPTWGTLSQVDAHGYVKTVANGFKTPQQVAVGPDGLIYVSGQGDNKVWKVDPASNFASSSFAVVTAPFGLAFDTSGNLFVSSNQGAGAVAQLNSGGSIVNAYSGFTNPQSIALDYAGMLYVVEAGGAITKLTPSDPAGNPRALMAYLSTPSGLAIDSAGNLFVTCTSSNCISRVDPAGHTSVFAMVNSPGGIAFDDSGALFTSDTSNNLIYRISPSGNLLIFAYGISTPRGLAVDPSTGVVYVSLYKSNAILQVNPADGVLKPLVTGIAPPLTLTYRDGGLFIAQPDINSVSFADPSGRMTTVGTNLTQPSGADKDPVTGKIYVGRYGIPWFSWAYTSGWADGGFHVLNGASVTTVYPNQRKETSTLALDGSGTIYSVSTNGRQLTMSTPIGNGAFRTRLLYSFANSPSKVALDAANNVYVSVGAENKVYRFRVAANYAKEEITGFSGPWGLAFDAGGTLWVSNTVDGKLRKVTSPEQATTTVADAWVSSVVGTGVRGLAYIGGDLYMANGTKLDWYTIAAATSSTFASGLPTSISDVWGHAGDAVYAYSNSDYVYKVDLASRVSTYFVNGDGRMSAIAFDSNWKLYRARSSEPNIISTAVSPAVNLVRLGYTNEIALDGDQLYFTTTFSSGESGGGAAGIYRFDLTSGLQYLYPMGVTWSLAVTSGHAVYVGTDGNKIVELNTATGQTTDRFTLGTRPYGLDVSEGTSPPTLWAVGADGRVFEMPVGGAMVPHYYGMMQPRF